MGVESNTIPPLPAPTESDIGPEELKANETPKPGSEPSIPPFDDTAAFAFRSRRRSKRRENSQFIEHFESERPASRPRAASRSRAMPERRPFLFPPPAKAKSDMAKRVDIDGEGDLIVAFPDIPDSLNIKASSTVLSIASPVLKGVFAGGITRKNLRFVEKLIPEEGRVKYRLDMHEYDPEAMLVICRIIHHRASDLPGDPSTALLQTLALTCRKLQCGSILMSWGSLWLQHWSPPEGEKREKVLDAWQVLNFAYIAGLADMFMKAAWVLLSENPGPLETTQWQPRPGTDFQSLLANFLDGRREQFLNTLQHALMAPLLAPEWQCLWNGCCEQTAALLGFQNYTQALRRAGLAGASQFWLPDWSDMDFNEILAKLRSLDVVTIGQSQHQPQSTLCPGLTVESFTDDLQWLLDLIELNKGWYGCLMCFRAGSDRCQKHAAGLVLQGLFAKPPPVKASPKPLPARPRIVSMKRSVTAVDTNELQTTPDAEAMLRVRISPSNNTRPTAARDKDPARDKDIQMPIRRRSSKSPKRWRMSRSPVRDTKPARPVDETGNRGSEITSHVESESTAPFAFDPQEEEPGHGGR